MNTYCFVGGIVFDHQENEVKQNSKCGLQNAPNAFQLAFIDGLRSNVDELDVINLPFTGSFPLNYKKILSPRSEKFEYKNSQGLNISCYNQRFVNLIYAKLYFREHACYNALKKYYNSHKNSTYVNIIVYSVHLPFLKAAIKLKKKHDNVRIIDVVTDLPEFKNDTSSRLWQLLNNYDTHVGKDIYNAVDGYILLTEHMSKRIITNCQPYEIIEGLYNTSDSSENTTNSDTNQKIIFYSGTLAKRYNILSLVKAFQQIKDKNYRLVICGSGSCKKEIQNAAKIDTRIQFKGEISRNEVLRLQKNASLLVNPRTNENEYTKYSFPSKTMEYLASGVPTLIYKLEGIPDEYYNHCFTLTDTSITALKNKIVEILSLTDKDRTTIGHNAKKFILENKTACQQCRKVVKLINALENKNV